MRSAPLKNTFVLPALNEPLNSVPPGQKQPSAESVALAEQPDAAGLRFQQVTPAPPEAPMASERTASEPPRPESKTAVSQSQPLPVESPPPNSALAVSIPESLQPPSLGQITNPAEPAPAAQSQNPTPGIQKAPATAEMPGSQTQRTETHLELPELPAPAHPGAAVPAIPSSLESPSHSRSPAASAGGATVSGVESRPPSPDIPSGPSPFGGLATAEDGNSAEVAAEPMPRRTRPEGPPNLPPGGRSRRSLRCLPQKTRRVLPCSIGWIRVRR